MNKYLNARAFSVVNDCKIAGQSSQSADDSNMVISKHFVTLLCIVTEAKRGSKVE